eukprot:12568619-Alexandrium_andersonii.AAC.1
MFLLQARGQLGQPAHLLPEAVLPPSLPAARPHGCIPPPAGEGTLAVSYTHLRAHETSAHL